MPTQRTTCRPAWVVMYVPGTYWPVVGLVKPGGCLAVQMPQSWSAPSHRLMRETLANGGPHGEPVLVEDLPNNHRLRRLIGALNI